MKDVAIVESGKEFKFSGTGKLETELQDGGSCYWVPKEERETGHIFASENRDYTADEISKYGINSVDVNIIFTGTTIDGDPWSVTIDPDTGLPIIDIDDVEITIDDVTGDIDIITPDIEITIDDEMLNDFGIDPISDIDISIDDLGNIEISDGDIFIDLDPETGELEKTGDCPASIYILSRPASLVYTDGDELNFTGLAVAALDKDGMDWPDPSTFTPISLDSIVIPTTKADIDSAVYEQAVVNGDIPVCIIPTGFVAGDGPLIFNYKTTISIEVWDGSSSPIEGSFAYVNQDDNGVYYYKPSVPQARVVAVYIYAEGPWAGSFAGYNPAGAFSTIPAPVSSKPISKEENIDSVDSKGATVPVTVQWTSPCLETLETTFDITVSPKTDHGGSHHSGEF